MIFAVIEKCVKKCCKLFKNFYFIKSLIINDVLKKLLFSVNFCLENVWWFQKVALPLYSLSGTNAAMQTASMMILENIPYRQAVQRSLFEKLNKEIKCKVRNEKRTVNY